MEFAFRRHFAPFLVTAVGLALLMGGVALAGQLLGTREPVVEAVPLTPTTTIDITDSRVVAITPVEDFRQSPPDRTVIDGVFLLGNDTVTLAYQPLDGLGGAFVPWVVPSADQTNVYYTMWEERRDLDTLRPGEVGGIPVIRKFDLSTGEEQVWRRGAYAVAASLDGRVAFVQDLDGAYVFSEPNPNRVMVSTPDGADEVWSTETDVTYITVGWAGETLIAYFVGQGEFVRTFAFDGPGERRLLSDGGTVGAISPDGTEVLIVETYHDGSKFAVKRVSDGVEVASLDPAEEGLGVLFSAYGGDWRRDRIVLPAGRDSGGQVTVGVVVLERNADSLALLKLAELPSLTYVPEWPRFRETGVIWFRAAIPVDGSDRYIEVECDLETDSCRTVSPPVDMRTSAIVGNASRGVSR